MIRSCLYAVIVLVLLHAASYADGQGGTESPFSFGAGARELSLGGADLAAPDAATAPFWNASRLARAEQYTLSAYHCMLYESDVMYQYVGLAVPTLDFGSFGIGVFRLGIDAIEKRDEHDLVLGEFDDNRLGLYAAYARTVSKFDLGVALYLEHHSIDNFSTTSSPGLDISASRVIEFDHERIPYLAIVLSGRNLLKPSMKLSDEKIDYPTAGDFAVSMKFRPNPGWNHSLILSAKATKVDYLDPAISSGVEYDIEHLLFLRGGIRGGKLSAGIGIGYKGVRFDYAMVDRDMGAVHMLSLSAWFGKTVADRREQRILDREREFNQLMQEKLQAQNRQRVSQLIAEGERFEESAQFPEALSSLDRALFLARGSGLDTLDITQMMADVRNRFDEIAREERFNRFLDSARTRYSDGNLSAARYFAELALSENPESQQAKDLFSAATREINRLASREELVRQQLSLADSLLTYGQVEQALTTLRALEDVAPDNGEVRHALRRTQFEQLRKAASGAYSDGDFETAADLLDSALVLYPRHKWCEDLKSRIRRELGRVSAERRIVEPADRARLTPELEREVAAAYQVGQELFKSGDLAQAIIQWETVERLAPAYKSVRTYLVNAYKFVGVDFYTRNEFDQAVTVWKKAIQLDPSNVEIREYIRRTETEIRKMQELSYDR